MVVVRRLVRNGSSTQLTMPPGFLRACGWKPGDQIAIELAEDKTIWIRRPAMRDFQSGSDRVLMAAPMAVLSR